MSASTAGGHTEAKTAATCTASPKASTVSTKDMELSIIEQLNRIERNTLLAAKNVLTFDDVAALTGLSKSHLYKLTCTRQIPHYKPNGKNIYFDRAEVEAWLTQNRYNAEGEAEAAAAAYVVREGL